MFAIHDRFSQQMRNRLKTTVMGLGLVRLLQDAGLNDAARDTLFLLEFGCQAGPEKSAKAGYARNLPTRRHGRTRLARPARWRRRKTS